MSNREQLIENMNKMITGFQVKSLIPPKTKPKSEKSLTLNEEVDDWFAEIEREIFGKMQGLKGKERGTKYNDFF